VVAKHEAGLEIGERPRRLERWRWLVAIDIVDDVVGAAIRQGAEAPRHALGGDCRFGFFGQPAAHLGLVGGKHLDGHALAERRMHRLVDVAEISPRERMLDAKLANHPAGLEIGKVVAHSENVPRRTNWPRPSRREATHTSFSTTTSPRDSTWLGAPRILRP